MSRKTWTQVEIEELKQRICYKVKHSIKLTCGEDVVWGVIKEGKTLTTSFVEEVDFMMCIDFDEITDFPI